MVKKLLKIRSCDPGSEIRDSGSGNNLFLIPDPDPQHCIAGIPAIVVLHFVIDIAAVVCIKTEDFMVFALVIFFARLHNFAGFSG
jgi:hypothetical protein